MSSSIANYVTWFYKEFGLKSIRETGPDAWLIIANRAGRMLAYGSTSFILALFLSGLDFSDSKIGLFMTLALLGDVFLSGFFSLVADQIGRRRILLAGSLLMVTSGLAFALFENFWILLFAAVVGVLSTSGSDIGPFRAIEESTLSHLTTSKTRPDVLAWYITTASIGSALGAEFSGRIYHYLQHLDGWTAIDAYHAGFFIYAGMGFLNILLTLMLSKNCEANEKPATEESGTLLREMEGAEGEHDADDGNEERESSGSESGPVKLVEPQKKKSRFAQISKDTRSVMYKLWFLLAVDALADGMTGYSLTFYYINQKFDVRKSTLGDITAISYFLSSFSSMFASSLARRLGLINTMVFTHLPSSAAVLLFPVPRGLFFTVALFFVRTGLNNLDQAPRSAFIAAVTKPEERTAVMGITNIVRTLGATAGPTLTGILADNDRFWIAFVVAGVLRIAYDLGLFAMFVNYKVNADDEV